MCNLEGSQNWIGSAFRPVGWSQFLWCLLECLHLARDWVPLCVSPAQLNEDEVTVGYGDL